MCVHVCVLLCALACVRSLWLPKLLQVPATVIREGSRRSAEDGHALLAGVWADRGRCPTLGSVLLQAAPCCAAPRVSCSLTSAGLAVRGRGGEGGNRWGTPCPPPFASPPGGRLPRSGAWPARGSHLSACRVCVWLTPALPGSNSPCVAHALGLRGGQGGLGLEHPLLRAPGRAGRGFTGPVTQCQFTFCPLTVLFPNKHLRLGSCLGRSPAVMGVPLSPGLARYPGMRAASPRCGQPWNTLLS